MKKSVYLITCLACMYACGSPQKSSFSPQGVPPINPASTEEARNLLSFLYSISGHRTLSGQHNVVKHMSVFTDSIYMHTSKHPAIWSSDFGFSDSRHDIDNIKYRENIVKEAIKQFEAGSIITLSYHQANPVEGEPCLFNPGVIYKMTDEQWNDLLTPGTQIYNNWYKQMILIAQYLRQLEIAKIPVLFRPYHEMNGNWFWWGGRPGNDGFIALWKQLYHLYTDELKINNLLWVWSSDRPWVGVDKYYPGADYVDVVGADIYPPRPRQGTTYRMDWYNRVDSIANGKPFAITECSLLPTVEEFNEQPKWVWFLSWNNMVTRATPMEDILAVFHSPRTINRDELVKINH